MRSEGKIVLMIKQTQCYEDLWGVEVYSQIFITSDVGGIGVYLYFPRIFPRKRDLDTDRIGWMRLKAFLDELPKTKLSVPAGNQTLTRCSLDTRLGEAQSSSGRGGKK
jgi:hypothetical protein